MDTYYLFWHMSFFNLTRILHYTQLFTKTKSSIMQGPTTVEGGSTVLYVTDAEAKAL